ncbi:D-alanyl-D-alanine carboxypeptidase family protein [Aliarcobacter cryaerophilus]|uniref:D-alanyl-D-alanine carboxypeptidase family protein n=2 Tax=Aliarcobacter cryaerophilus TaxID=28198 RepID=UPI003DA3B39A
MSKIFLLIIFIFLQIGYAKSSSYIVLDTQTKEVLNGENIDTKLPIASLTKIWTALLVLENCNLDSIVKISKKASIQEGSSIYLKENEEYKVRDLVYGMLLRSGNDAAVALAEYTFGSEEKFVEIMNKKTKELGLENTKFVDATGLGNNTSTANDVANMLNIALNNYKFKGISSKLSYKNSLNGQFWKNKHKLIGKSIYNAISGKTGYTKEAGRTLATAFKHDSKTYIVVTLNEKDDWNIHELLVSKVFAKVN